MTIEGLALNLATAAEVQFNLMRLMMATLFTSTPGEEQTTYFRQEAYPDETQSIIRGMLEAMQTVVDATSTLLVDTLIWRRKNSLAKASVPIGQRQGLISHFLQRDPFLSTSPWLRS